MVWTVRSFSLKTRGRVVGHFPRPLIFSPPPSWLILWLKELEDKQKSQHIYKYNYILKQICIELLETCLQLWIFVMRISSRSLSIPLPEGALFWSNTPLLQVMAPSKSWSLPSKDFRCLRPFHLGAGLDSCYLTKAIQGFTRSFPTTAIASESAVPLILRIWS